MSSIQSESEWTDQQRMMIDRHRELEREIKQGVQSWNKRQSKQAEMRRIRDGLVESGLERGVVNDLFFSQE
jgi:hypothetical protein